MSDHGTETHIDEATNDELLESLKSANRADTVDYVVFAIDHETNTLKATNNLPDTKSVINLLLKVRDDLVVFQAQQISEENFERTLELVQNEAQGESEKVEPSDITE